MKGPDWVLLLTVTVLDVLVAVVPLELAEVVTRVVTGVVTGLVTWQPRSQAGYWGLSYRRGRLLGVFQRWRF